MTATTEQVSPALQQRIYGKLAQRDASLPQELLVDIVGKLGLQPLPREAIPRKKESARKWRHEATSVFPADSVLDAPGKVLEPQDVEIASKPVEELLPLLASGKLSAVRCLQAFLAHAVLAQQLLNPVTEMFAEKALARAKECDDYLAKNGKTLGPLHGLPVSLKDQFNVKDLDTVMGYAAGIGQPKEENSVVVDLLLRAGAVLYVRTNVPQSLMRAETDNNVFGRTLNPANRSFTSGGSSGGEGVLVAMRGSPLGVGTDIGGSVRIPAGFNGLWGFRPSMHRIPYEGAENSFKGQESIASVIGPITPSLEGCVAFMRAILGGCPWEQDPIAVAMPFNESAYRLEDLQLRKGSDSAVESYQKGKTQLCFAIAYSDGVVHPHPPILRALKETKAKLEQAGHKIIEWVPYKPAEAAVLVGKIWTADGGVDVATEAARGEEPLFYNACMASDEAPPHLNTYDMWQLNREKAAWQKGLLDYFNATVSQTGTGRPIDGIIAPIAPYASCPHDTNDWVGTTAVWNLGDRPCCTFPVTSVDTAKDAKAPLPEAAFSEMDQEIYDRYDPQKWHGMPVNLQLVGKRLQDEEVLGLAHVLVEAGVTPAVSPVVQGKALP